MFRLSARSDPAFLAEIERPPLDDVLARPENARYVEHWGRPGDVAFYALDRRDEPIAAAWYRRFTSDAPGYGFVADDIPEVAIAVYPEFRGQKVGNLLMGALTARAERDHERALSLSVHGDNPARRLYVRHGFEVHAHDGDTLTMLRSFDDV
jgi:ribosomal protein S18 acetylase RimI-like enzyme